MINIIKSQNLHATASTQTLMNDLVDLWDWEKVVYDETTPTNVTQLWVSDKVYLSIGGTYRYISLNHTNGYSTSINESPSSYRIVQTDTALMVHYGEYYFAIGTTVDGDGIESVGIAANATSMYFYTDNMINANYITPPSTNNITSNYHTQLIPIYPPNSNAHFTDVYINYIRKSTDFYKVVLNGENFYMWYFLSISYTP